MEKLNKITVPAGQKLRQLQKIVHDIKKNDSGIMSKFKKLTSKPPPSIPPVDYVPDHTEEEEQWSDDFDSDYENPDHHSDSEMYVVPTEENCDDNYEPPPSEHEQKKIPVAFSCPRGVYADKQSSQQKTWPPPLLPNQSSTLSKKPAILPLPPSAVQKPKLPPKPTDEEADYVVPVDNDDEDNYIEPTEESTSHPVKPPVVNRSTKPPCSVSSPSTLDVYEVPEEEKSTPPLLRISKPLPPKPVLRPAGGHSHERNIPKESFTPDVFKSDRNILPLPRHRPSPKVEPESLGTPSDGNSSNSAPEFKILPVTVPSPFPRITKKLTNPAIPPKPGLPDRDHLNVTEDKPIPAERRRGSSHDIPLPPIPSSVQKPLPQKPPILSRSPEPASHTIGTRSNNFQGGSTTADQDAGVLGQAWYLASSDRKIAEDALHKSNKDGSFLVRKSSGQDLKQPYTLVVFYNKRVYNIPVRFIESKRQYALGREKSGEEYFDSVAEIIENHQRTSLVLIDSQNNTKDSTRLKYIARVS